MDRVAYLKFWSPPSSPPMDAGGRRRSDGPRSVKVALTSLSAMAAETATFPIDTTKTRLQLLRSSSPATGGAARVAAEICRSHGLAGLYRGLPPAVLRHLFYTPIRILAYERLRLAVPGDSLAGRAVAGGFSGVVAQVRDFDNWYSQVATAMCAISN